MFRGIGGYGHVRDGCPQVHDLRPGAQGVFQPWKVRLQILAGGQHQPRLSRRGNILRRGLETVQVAVGFQQIRDLDVAAAQRARHVPQHGVQGRDLQGGGLLGAQSTEQAQKTQKRN